MAQWVDIKMVRESVSMEQILERLPSLPVPSQTGSA